RTAHAPSLAAPISFLTKAPNDWVFASDSDYTNQESIGTIKGLLKGSDGKIAAAVICVSRVLGIGRRICRTLFSSEDRTAGQRPTHRPRCHKGRTANGACIPTGSGHCWRRYSWQCWEPNVMFPTIAKAGLIFFVGHKSSWLRYYSAAADPRPLAM